MDFFIETVEKYFWVYVVGYWPFWVILFALWQVIKFLRRRSPKYESSRKRAINFGLVICGKCGHRGLPAVKIKSKESQEITCSMCGSTDWEKVKPKTAKQRLSKTDQ